MANIDDFLYKIFNEDCRVTISKLPDESIDLVVTSPPYDNLRRYKDNPDDFTFEIFKEVAQGLSRVITKGGVIVWIVNDGTINGSETGTSFRQALYFKDECGLNLHDTMIWYKKTLPQTGNRYEPSFEYMFVFSKGKPKTFNPIMVHKKYQGGNRERWQAHRKTTGEPTVSVFISNESPYRIDDNVWAIPVGHLTKDKIAYLHPAIFPEQLAARHIISWSNEGDIVYDPFAGSGTTCKMAKLLQRKWFGSELSRAYCEIAEQRLAATDDLFTIQNILEQKEQYVTD